jgi:hypothetical protein
MILLCADPFHCFSRPEIADRSHTLHHASTPTTAPEFPHHSVSAGRSTPSFSPLYQQIKGLILQSLQAGEWRPAS